MSSSFRILFGLLALLSLVSRAKAADWPTYRGDNHRSGYTAETLPKDLATQWVYRARHAPQPAWTSPDTRMPFDRVYRPVIAHGTVFFGSSADCKVYALDAATGSERWTFFTNGPIRFAPTVWQDRVLVVSDDGYLYCLSAAEGKLLWKLRGGPRDDMLLGNDRMISRWPARGGPVIADNVVYFAAGIWPSEGIYVYAVDAATGNVLWCNDTSGAIHMPQPHGGANAHSGISAQGHLVVCGEFLLVPTGRAAPAVLSRADGKLRYFHLQANHANGGANVAATDSLFFNGGHVFEADTGRSAAKGIGGTAIALTPQGLIHARRKGVFRSQLVEKEVADRKGNTSVKTLPGKPEPLIESPETDVCSLLVAAQQIVVGREGSIDVIDGTSKEIVASVSLPDEVPYGLALADGRLLVSTDKGRIYCLGQPTEQETVVESITEGSPYGENGPFEAAAEEIIQQTGITDGYCLDLNCGDGALAYALAKRTKLHIYAVDPDPEKVAVARQKLAAAGLYGVRVTVHQADPAATTYPNYFANLVVSGRSVTEGSGVVPVEEMQRLQRPFGGVACIGKPGVMEKSARGPLQDAGTWTHQYCDPANTNCSTDTLAQGPLGMLWFTDLNFQMPSRHGRGPAPMFLDGRMFVEGRDAIRGVDAYNGRTLWEFPLPKILKAYDQEHLMGTAGTGSNCCVTADAVYVRTGSRCLRIDPADGKLLAEFPAPKMPDGSDGIWAYLACVDGTLLGTLANTEHLVKYRYGRSEMSTQFTESMLLFAMDAKTGRLKWTYRPEQSIRNNAIAVGHGRVYLIDRQLASKDDARRGDKNAKHEPGALVALDMETGQPQWKADEGIYGTMLALSEEHDVLLVAYQNTRFKLDSEIGGRMAAFRASDGEPLWDIEAQYGSRPIINDQTIYAQPGAWDLLSGQQKDFKFERSYGCGILAGSRNLLVYRSATLGYTDLLHNSGNRNYGGIRPGCWINVIPAGGLVLMPDATDRCTCSYLIKASIALQPMDQ